MGQINKGTIASISGNTARVMHADESVKPTAMIVIPWHLRGEAGNLKKGTEVVYVEFDDATGLLLGRADGEWGAYLPTLTAGDVVTSGGVSLKDHTHGVTAGDGSTSAPQTTNPHTAELGACVLGQMQLGN